MSGSPQITQIDTDRIATPSHGETVDCVDGHRFHRNIAGVNREDAKNARASQRHRI